MARDANIPLFLWIATAVLVHLVSGGGAERVSAVIGETLDIGRFAQNVQKHVRSTNKPLEVALLDSEDSPEEADPTDDEKKPDDTEEEDEPEDEDPSAQDDPTANSTKPPPEEKPKPDVKLAEKPPEEKKPEEKPEEQKKPPVEALEKPPPELELQRRIAVRQVVKDPNQADNPDAEFLGDEANKVEEQSQARITSTDQNEAQPNPAGQHSNADQNPGNANESKVAQSEERAGEKDHAPSEDSAPAQRVASQLQPRTGSPTATRNPAAQKEQDGRSQGSLASKSDSKLSPQTGQRAQSATRAAEAVPDTLNSSRGGFTVPGPRQAMVDQAARKSRRKRELPQRRSNGRDVLGFGAAGTTENGVNLNLMPSTAVASIGRDQLVRERRADGERRLSQHRGSWKGTDLNKWKSAIENYVPSVKPGNQTALNTARAPFATYLNTIHNRLHPIFADSFLSSLDSLTADHPMNRPDLSTNLEIVVDQAEGKLMRMGVTKASGVTAFDVAALESVKRAGPFGMPPAEIVSPDGNVYLHWEFHRNPDKACSTYFARPFILKVQPKSAPPDVEPPAPPFNKERSPEGERHGSREPAGRGTKVARN
jgi:hypothetical protein